ncbi:MAG TPA: M20/M25/M40 family metallo-hydrolase [Cryomorphaceae bacterium]|nr:M20/M25/M40 family metallo-hydrolase [Cryomorphaceae bacterium]HKL40601.1 M20/M25/M40 family metallo-hydrolase [Cryomorphaceae bacterium]
MNTELLKKLCAIPSTAGDEGRMKDFILDYFAKNSQHFKVTPKVYSGAGFQDMVIAIFGEPRTAVLAHTDTVGFTVAYKKELYKIGNPKAKEGSLLVGEDSKGKIECTLKIEKKKSKKAKEEVFKYEASRTIEPGTNLTYAPDWSESKKYVKSAYLDNRLGVWNALELGRTLRDGALVFTTYEEHGGGGAQFAGKFLQDNFGVQQALISDVTLLSESIKHNKGVAISMRDRGIPRRSFVNRIIEIAKENEVKYQLEVEKAGGSDGNALQDSPYAWDWCFIGPPEDNYHRPGEKVHKEDMAEMQKLYKALMISL